MLSWAKYLVEMGNAEMIFELVNGQKKKVKDVKTVLNYSKLEIIIEACIEDFMLHDIVGEKRIVKKLL